MPFARYIYETREEPNLSHPRNPGRESLQKGVFLPIPLLHRDLFGPQTSICVPSQSKVPVKPQQKEPEREESGTAGVGERSQTREG